MDALTTSRQEFICGQCQLPTPLRDGRRNLTGQLLCVVCNPGGSEQGMESSAVMKDFSVWSRRTAGRRSYAQYSNEE